MADEVIQVIADEPVVVSVTTSATSTTSDSTVIQISGDESVPAAVAYHHSQGISSNTWDIEHNLGFYPNVTTMDSSGSIAEGEIEHLSKYRLRVTFSAPFSGNAYLS